MLLVPIHAAGGGVAEPLLSLISTRYLRATLPPLLRPFTPVLNS